MQDRPDARELIDAVAAFLEREILPTLTDPRLRFRGLIAINVLGVVTRELAAGDAPTRDEWRRLVALAGRPAADPPERPETLRQEVRALSRDLCARIRAGEFDDEPAFGAALAHAEATVVAKLRVANPRYLERVLSSE